MPRERLSYQHFGLTIYKLDDGTEWAVGDDKVKDAKGRTRVDRAARRAVIDSLWAFNTDFIVDFIARRRPGMGRVLNQTRAHAAIMKGIKDMQEKLCEDASPVVRLLIGPHLNAFVEEAIRADGRGHFLSSYDSEERDSDDVEGLPKGKIAYRLN